MGTTTAITFARRLREERERAGLSQAAMAERLSEALGSAVDASTVTRMEKNQRSVKIDEAVAMASVLGVELADLVSEEGAAAARRRELGRELERQQGRAEDALREHQQATQAMIDLERQIESLGSPQA